MYHKWNFKYFDVRWRRFSEGVSTFHIKTTEKEEKNK